MGARHAVVHERAAQRLAGIVDHALLPERLADSLHDRAMRLAMDDERIDATADIVDRGIAAERQPAGVGVDLDLADGAAIGKYRLVHFVIGNNGKSTSEFDRQLL